MAEVSELVTEWRVSALPLDHQAGRYLAVWVQWRGGDRYCVSIAQDQHPNKVWSRSENDWVWESIPSERSDEFIADTRFSLSEALDIARRIAPNVQVNGLNAADILARDAEREATR